MSIFDGLKELGLKMGKGFLIEAYLIDNEPEMIVKLKEILDDTGLTAEDIPDFIYNHKALPVPQKTFSNLKGYEDYIETIDPVRLFEWLTKARPDLGLAVAACGDEGAEYMARLKWFFVDSIKAAPVKKETTKDSEKVPENEAEVPEDVTTTPEEDPNQLYRVTCNECEEHFDMTKEQIANLTECPSCGAPANLQLGPTSV